MIGPELIADAKARIAALDLSHEIARLAEIDESIRGMEAAVRESQARREEIGATLRTLKTEDRGAEVADLIMAGVAALDAPAMITGEAYLQRDREDLKTAMHEILKRKDRAIAERNTVLMAAHQRIAAELWPLADAIEAEAQQAASTLVRCFASLAAIGEASKSAHPGLYALREAVPGLHLMVPRSVAIDVPEPILEALASLKHIAPKLTGPVLRKVAAP